MPRIISFSNRKGGNGKTTTAVNVSAGLADRGKRVLLVDTDPQAHSSLSLGYSQKRVQNDLYGLLVDNRPPQSLFLATYLESLQLIAASRRLTDFEMQYSPQKSARTWLAERLAPIHERFDYIIFDTPPTLGLLTISALISSTELIVPLQAHFLAMEGLAEMIRVVHQINRLYNPELKLKGIIPTFYSPRTRLSRAIIYEIRKNLGEKIILHPIRMNIALAEAPSYGKTIFQYKAHSNGALDYLSVIEQIEEMS